MSCIERADPQSCQQICGEIEEVDNGDSRGQKERKKKRQR